MLWRRKPTSGSVTTRIVRPFSVSTGGQLRVMPSNHQHVGARNNQEDSFAFSDLTDRAFTEKKGILAVLADGMGGLARGEVASNTAVNTFLREYAVYNGNQNPVTQGLELALRVANTAVYDLTLDSSQELDLGTTLVAAVIHRDRLYWISAGDSRLYLLRNEVMRQLTTDHIYANHLAEDVAKGLLSREEAANHPERAHLTSYLGLPELKEISRSEQPINLLPQDRIVLCSDGLFDTLGEQEIASTLVNNYSNAAEALVEQALLKNKQYQDNVTVVVLTCLQPAKRSR